MTVFMTWNRGEDSTGNWGPTLDSAPHMGVAVMLMVVRADKNKKMREGAGDRGGGNRTAVGDEGKSSAK